MVSFVSNDRRLIVNQSKSDGVGCSLRHRTSGTRLDRGANRLRQQPGTERSRATVAVRLLMKKPSLRLLQALQRHGVRSAAVQKRSSAGAGSHGSLFRVGPENPSSWWTVHPGRIGKYGNFPKPSLGNFANFRERTPRLLLGFS